MTYQPSFSCSIVPPSCSAHQRASGIASVVSTVIMPSASVMRPR